METCKVTSVLEGHQQEVLSVCFAPDGTTLASGSADHTVRLWDVETGDEKMALKECNSAVETVLFSPDGRTLATGGKDTEVILWNMQSEAISYEDAVIMTGCHLKGFEVSQLPESTYYPNKRDFVAEPGFDFEAAPPAEAPPNPHLEFRWPEDSPYHWIPGARNGEAKALYNLAVIRERQKNDEEAKRLHRQCAQIDDPEQQELVEKSKWRLETMPWLRD